MIGPDSHVCFGCGRQLADQEKHIHVPLDDFAAREGLGPSLGLDDLLTFTFCDSCTKKTEDGWQPEQHDIPGEEACDDRS